MLIGAGRTSTLNPEMPSLLRQDMSVCASCERVNGRKLVVRKRHRGGKVPSRPILGSIGSAVVCSRRKGKVGLTICCCCGKQLSAIELNTTARRCCRDDFRKTVDVVMEGVAKRPRRCSGNAVLTSLPAGFKKSEFECPDWLFRTP